tara:strand:+ start:237 stop:461 length:225 start_codon:yes stop_codon:yes gene_type:complete
MPKAATLNKIGSNVKIQVDRVKDRIPKALLQKLTKDPRGKVIDYKMTDGTGIGLVIRLSDGTTSWFFDDEINNR